jgi:adenylosuccinate synthase
MVERGVSILFEGAQGTFLDVDHGTYPYVTASNTVAGAACAGAGVGPRVLGRVIGVAKAYATRVGAGPFATELPPGDAARLREAGREYGSTTGRPRRCGWFDAAQVRLAARLNGLDSLAVTKLDVLSGLSPLRVAAAVDRSGDPLYDELPGWSEPLSACRTLDELPAAARAYLRHIEDLVGIPIGLVGVGPGREEAIAIDAAFAPGRTPR